MAFNLKKTDGIHNNNVLMVAHGSGLLSIKDADLSYIEVPGHVMISAYRFVPDSAETKESAPIDVDSISEMSIVYVMRPL